MIGTKLAHYEITSHLGSGGMGEVYQATDSKLGRSVAIKLLPEAFTHDGDRAARFEREARLLASLNHSNIAAIHGIEESGGRKFLVMELVGGETLAERIRRGPISIDEALPIAKQIAEALESAHEKGIIHRDLKPANIKITPQGQVKVLDFGLAKAFAGEGADMNLSNSPTLSMAATNAGVILGTAAYMSPEQAKGKDKDRTTDIWAFGCVLYEMLTGRAAFAGETLGEILGSVFKAEPEWNRLPSELSFRIRELLHLCLQKDAKNRRQTITDVRIDIEKASEEPLAIRFPQARSSLRPWIASLAVAGVLVLALAIPAVRHLRETPPVSPLEMRVEIVTPATVDPISFALSPDGRQIAFVASGDGPSRLWLRSLNSTTAQPLPGSEGAAFPFWSPDSRALGFFSNRSLKRLDVGGGSPQVLAEVVGSPRGGTWNADGVILFTPNTASPLFRVPASGEGEAVAVTKLDRQTSHRFPEFLPDGRQFLFYAAGTPETAGIYLGSLDSAATRRLTGADTAGLYVSSGWLVWVRAGTLVGQHLDLERKELTGDQVILADSVVFNANSAARGVSVSAAGLVAYRAGGADRRQLVWFDRSSKSLSAMGVPDENDLSYPKVSPDGRRVAAQRFLQGTTDIWLLDGTRRSQFTFDASGDYSPIWSPDGSRIVFANNRKGHRDLYQKPFSAAGVEVMLEESSQDKTPTHWSKDGRFILYHAAESQTNHDLWVRSMDERRSFLFLKTSFDERHGQFSPNGRWVAYMSNASRQEQIYILPFAVPATCAAATNPVAVPKLVSTTGGSFPRWRSDGKELYYIGPNGEMMAAPITFTGTTLEPGPPVSLFPTRIYGGGVEDQASQQYDLAGDDRFLINTVIYDSNSPITLRMNWKPAAK